MILRNFSLVLVFVFTVTNIASIPSYAIDPAALREIEIAQAREEVAGLDSEQINLLKEKLSKEKSLLDQQAAEHTALLSELNLVTSRMLGFFWLTTISSIGTYQGIKTIPFYSSLFKKQVALGTLEKSALRKAKLTKVALITLGGTLLIVNAGILTLAGSNLLIFAPAEFYKVRTKIKETAAKIEIQRIRIQVLQEVLATADQ